ncbi:MAG: hypothetical protein GVY09_12925 [Gammaproteobacteria bacterium]|nr:hypothetical protein [Gammaproteobacteria bacterium]
MRFRSPTLVIACAALPLVAGCDMQVEDGEMPDVEVSADPGQLPKYDVEKTQEGQLPSVDVDAEPGQMPQVDLQAPDVDVDTQSVSVPVPDVDVDMPKGQADATQQQQ